MTKGIRIIKRSAHLKEIKNGWLNTTTGQVYKTAIGAQQAIERLGKAIAFHAETDGSKAAVVTTITWEPTSKVGTLVVKAITNQL